MLKPSVVLLLLVLGAIAGFKLDDVQRGEPYRIHSPHCDFAVTNTRLNYGACSATVTEYGQPFLSHRRYTAIMTDKPDLDGNNRYSNRYESVQGGRLSANVVAMMLAGLAVAGVLKLASVLYYRQRLREVATPRPAGPKSAKDKLAKDYLAMADAQTTQNMNSRALDGSRNPRWYQQANHPFGYLLSLLWPARRDSYPYQTDASGKYLARRWVLFFIVLLLGLVAAIGWSWLLAQP